MGKHYDVVERRHRRDGEGILKSNCSKRQDNLWYQWVQDFYRVSDSPIVVSLNETPLKQLFGMQSLGIKFESYSGM